MMTGFFQNFSDAFYKAVIKDQRYLAYLDGLKITILISIFAILIGIAIGLLVAVVKVSAVQRKELWIFNKICNIYITIIRGTPVMVQLLIIYNLIFTSRDTNALLVGAVCFGINSGAYVAEIIRAGIESIDKGQMEAGRSLGLNYLQTMKEIIIPQAIKNILPALGNEFIVLIKETSIASVIAAKELMYWAGAAVGATIRVWEPYITIALIYLVLTLSLTSLMDYIERRLKTE